MNKLLTLIFALFLSGHVIAGDPIIEEKIETLNAASIESLGISLNALSYLVEASAYSYMPLSHLEESGKMAFINELEEAGYVKITKRVGLPDGQEEAETFINVRPLKTGEEIQQCIQALKHNQSSNSDAEGASS